MPAHADTPRSRGQQKDSKGHGRTSRPDLPVIEEEHDIAHEDRLCPICTEPYQLLSQTEDSDIVEIEVKGYCYVPLYFGGLILPETNMLISLSNRF